ncbi:MAG: ABC transporter substrate-binding protein [Acidimicrobiales bacterium]
MVRTGRLSSRRRAASVALTITAIVVVGACSDDGDATPPSSTSTTSTTVADAPGADDQLTVGVLLPTTGLGSDLGNAMIDAIQLAQQDIDAVGVKFRDVDLITVDESSLEGELPPTLDDLFGAPVDAVIGPASNLLAERLLPITIRAKVMTCSPTASAMSLDDVPDDGPLFIRTIASDRLQALALAAQLDAEGTDIVLAYVDDPFGRPFVAEVRDRLSELGATVLDSVPFDPLESDYTSIARRLAATGAPTIGIVGDPEAGPRLLQTLAPEIDPAIVTSIWMNDAMRVPTTGSYRRLDRSITELLHGVSTHSRYVDPAATGTSIPVLAEPFAANAYDCMNVIALAADQAKFISGPDMADEIVPLTSGGTSCSSYRSCKTAIEGGRGIDYNGPTDPSDVGLTIDERGDVVEAQFDLWSIDENGLDVTGGSVRVP